MKTKLSQNLERATIEANQLTVAVQETAVLFPLTISKFESLVSKDIAFLDMLTTRFSKLQDIIGAKLFPSVLMLLAEDNAPAFIDKLNRLEKIGYLEDAQWWLDLREIRNKVAYDYPDDTATLVADLNNYVVQAKALLIFWEEFKHKVQALLGGI